VTTLKMATWAAETCWWPLCNKIRSIKPKCMNFSLIYFLCIVIKCLYEEVKLQLRKIRVLIKRKIYTLYSFLHKNVPLLLPVSFCKPLLAVCLCSGGYRITAKPISAAVLWRVWWKEENIEQSVGRGAGEQADTAVALVKAYVPRIDMLKPQRKYNRKMCP
jgi:hypothetical protein